jgi:hypothetical protein
MSHVLSLVTGAVKSPAEFSLHTQQISQVESAPGRVLTVRSAVVTVCPHRISSTMLYIPYMAEPTAVVMAVPENQDNSRHLASTPSLLSALKPQNHTLSCV